MRRPPVQLMCARAGGRRGVVGSESTAAESEKRGGVLHKDTAGDDDGDEPLGPERVRVCTYVRTAGRADRPVSRRGDRSRAREIARLPPAPPFNRYYTYAIIFFAVRAGSAQ